MPTNITQGNSAQFIAEFVDSNGNTTTPTGATLAITYPLNNQGTTTASTSITMTLTGAFMTATWFSSVSSLGNAPWTVTATGTFTAGASGTIRVIAP